MLKIMLRFRSVDNSAGMLKLYKHLRQMNHGYRSHIAGEMVAIGMLIFLNDDPDLIDCHKLPEYYSDEHDNLPIVTHSLYTVEVDEDIYMRFIKTIVPPENTNQFTFFIRAACLLGYYHVMKKGKVIKKNHSTMKETFVQETGYETIVDDRIDMTTKSSDVKNTPAGKDFMSGIKELGS